MTYHLIDYLLLVGAALCLFGAVVLLAAPI